MNNIPIIKYFVIFLLLSGSALFAQNIVVTQTPIDGFDGIYVKDGLYNEKPCYKKGDYQIRYKGCRAKWVLVYKDTMYYRNMTDVETCPVDNWLTACKVKEISSKVPTFELITTHSSEAKGE